MNLFWTLIIVIFPIFSHINSQFQLNKSPTDRRTFFVVYQPNSIFSNFSMSWASNMFAYYYYNNTNFGYGKTCLLIPALNPSWDWYLSQSYYGIFTLKHSLTNYTFDFPFSINNAASCGYIIHNHDDEAKLFVHALRISGGDLDYTHTVLATFNNFFKSINANINVCTGVPNTRSNGLWTCTC